MEKKLSAMVEKLYERKTYGAPAKKDYKTLLEVIRAEKYDDSVNDSEEITKELDRKLDILRTYQKYCMEELYLYGKTVEQLTDEFRSELDIKKLTEKYIKTVSKKIRDEFMENVRELFDEIEGNSFRELKEERPADASNSADGIVTVNSSIVDVVKYAAEALDTDDVFCKNIFEKYYLQRQTNEQIAEWLSENLCEYVDMIRRSAVRRMRVAVVPRGFNAAIDAKKLS